MNGINMIKLAKKYSGAGFQVIPISPVTKEPSIKNWTKFQTRPMTSAECELYFKSAKGIALLCGGPKRVFLLDVDCKYDLSGNLWDRLKEKVPNKILKKMMVQETTNGGYHLACFAPANRLKGNEKLASRYTTAYEKHQVYLENYERPQTRDNALRIALNAKSKVLLETRSGTPEQAGGYFALDPTPGYKRIFGKLQEITEEEYDILVEICRGFNEVVDGKINLSAKSFAVDWKITPFEDYNENGDVVDLLVEYGWEIIDDRGDRVRFKRPGVSYSKSSALYDKETKIFNVFSTSTSFEVGKGYNPSGVFIEIVGEGDASIAYKELVNQEYGEK